jgi:hypothetical protein
MIRCDKCDRAFHIGCVNIDAMPEGDFEFFCADCPPEETHVDEVIEEDEETGEVKKIKSAFTIVDDVQWANDGPEDEDEPESADEKSDGERDQEDEKAETDNEADSDDEDAKKKRKEKKEKKKQKVKGKQLDGEHLKYSKEEIKAALKKNEAARNEKGSFKNFLAGVLLRSGETNPEAFKELNIPFIKPDEVKNHFGIKFDKPPENPPAEKKKYEKKPVDHPPMVELKMCRTKFRDGCVNFYHAASKSYYQQNLETATWSVVTGAKLVQLQKLEEAERQRASQSKS